MLDEHYHTAEFHTGVSDEVREKGYTKQPPVHEQYAGELDEGERFGLKWKVKVNALTGFQWAKAELVVMERSVNDDPITILEYEDLDHVPAVAKEKTADYFMKIAEQV